MGGEISKSSSLNDMFIDSRAAVAISRWKTIFKRDSLESGDGALCEHVQLLMLRV